MLKPSPQALTPVAEFFKVLSEVSRLQVLCCLKSGAKNVTEIIAATGLGQANVSKQLKMLTQAGMVVRRPQGISVFYEISDPIVFELCEIVCVDAKRLVVRHRLAVRLEEQTQQLEELQNLRDR
ncbi:MAG: putative HTH-type transcriptional regulator [Chroococcidiopsis cubana SAG 39.79]|uniref:Transcriptional regulator n=1 Tax=Chroococcidiopsis cubana SAG 39.79 TaxID=388085 RepID=A0AB37UTM8_9CYAN|nr:metalloregulator ArsR/SmtB family transcription factor [Chroococcidiopsis cubana]MDZ4878295.1 putative HTH-type transcriptional regulator [Chroococcidiopsis cubana SAG 39.79]PSB65760.1 transcriptional regulator [Chroococcidiopsis cubana CCALA 043]RUT14457.1 transcriptional regulator [Chroococcidiopsis cubana SAG 39.79]